MQDSGSRSRVFLGKRRFSFLRAHCSWVCWGGRRCLWEQSAWSFGDIFLSLAHKGPQKQKQPFPLLRCSPVILSEGSLCEFLHREDPLSYRASHCQFLEVLWVFVLRLVTQEARGNGESLRHLSCPLLDRLPITPPPPAGEV